jgi:hypothetical protein
MSQQDGTVGQIKFDAVEVESFHKADRQAAAAIVCLMAGIFALGLLGYIVVCLVVHAEPFPAVG